MHDGVKPDEQRRSCVVRGGPTRRSTKGQWMPEEDEILRKAVQRFNGKNWKKIAECLKDRTDVQCLHRWQKVLNPEVVKGPWSKEEDSIIIDLVNKCGPKKWTTIAQHLPGRIGKQCRERWHNHLNPGIKKEAWTQEEELALIRAHQIYGNKWAELTKFLPGRTDNAIKNHWNSSVKKKVDSYLASGLLSQFPPGMGLPNINSGNQSDRILPTTCSSSGTFVVEDSREERGGVNDDEESSYYEKDPSSSQNFNNEVGCSMPSDLNDTCQFIEHEIGASSATDDDISAAMELMLQVEPGFLMEFLTIFENHHGVAPPMDLSGSDNDDLEVVGPDSSENHQCCFEEAAATNSSSMILQSCNNTTRSSDISVVPIILIDDDFVYTSEPEPGSSSTCQCNGMDGKGGPKEDQMDQQANDSPLKLLVPGNNNNFGPLPVPSDKKEEEEEEDKSDPGTTTLCSPFFTCDLIQSGTAEEYYSPLGVRQMMRWSSINCLLSGDSPSSPTFTCTMTPSISILKKRHRDLLSPLSEKSQKKFKRHEFSDLAKNLSRLVDDTENNEEATRSSPFISIQDKENLNPEFVYRFGVSPPFKRSLESPSAWKSPSTCFINSFLSSPPRVVADTEITLEDFGFLFSPGDNRSYDAAAIGGLMKQTAANETPERCSKNQKADEENTSQFTSNVLVTVLKSAAKTFTCSTPPTPSILKKRHHRDLLLSPLSEKSSQNKFKRHDFSDLAKNLSRLVDAC